MNYLKKIAEETGTKQSSWCLIDGPDSGVGIDYWVRNKDTGMEANINIDQGEVTISYSDQD